MALTFSCINPPCNGFGDAFTHQNLFSSGMDAPNKQLTLTPLVTKPVVGPILTLPGFVPENICSTPPKPAPVPKKPQVKRAKRRIKPKQAAKPVQPYFVRFQGVRDPNARYETVKGADGVLYEAQVSNSGWRECQPRFSERPPAKTFWGRVGQGCMKVFDAVTDFISEPFTTLRNWIYGKPSPDAPLSGTEKFFNELGNFALSSPLYFCVPFPITASVVGFQCLNRFVNWALS